MLYPMHGVSSLGSMEDHAQADAELRVSGDDLTSNPWTVVHGAGSRCRRRSSNAAAHPRTLSLAMVYYCLGAACPASPSATSRLCISRRSGRGGPPTAEPQAIREACHPCGAWSARSPISGLRPDALQRQAQADLGRRRAVRRPPPASGEFCLRLPHRRRATDIPPLHTARRARVPAADDRACCIAWFYSSAAPRLVLSAPSRGRSVAPVTGNVRAAAPRATRAGLPPAPSVGLQRRRASCRRRRTPRRRRPSTSSHVSGARAARLFAGRSGT